MAKRGFKYFINWRCSCGHARVKADRHRLLIKGCWYRHHNTPLREEAVCTRCGEFVPIRPAITWK